MSMFNHKKFKFQNNSGNPIRLTDVKVVGSDDFHVEFIWSDTGLPIDLSLLDNGQIVRDDTPIDLSVYYSGDKDTVYDSSLNIPRVDITYECPIDSGNILTMNRSLRGTSQPTPDRPVSSVYISLADHSDPDKEGMMVELKSQRQNSGIYKWKSGRVNGLVYNNSDGSRSGEYILYYHVLTNAWILSLDFRDGSPENRLFKYTPDDNEYIATSRKYPTGWEIPTMSASAFPVDMSYHIPNSANSKDMPWKPLGESSIYNDNLFLLLSLSKPVDYDSRGMIHRSKFDLIDTVRAVHNVRKVDDGTRLEISWTEPPATTGAMTKWSGVHYIIEYTPYTIPGGQQQVPYRYLVKNNNATIGTGSNMRFEQLYTLELPQENLAYTVNGDSDFSGDLDPGTNKLKISPILPKHPGGSTIASKEINDTFPTLNFKVTPETRRLAVDVQVNGLRTLQRSGDSDVWAEGDWFSYGAINGGKRFDLKISAKGSDLSDLNGFVNKDDWSRDAIIYNGQTGIEIGKKTGDGFLNGDVVLPVLDDDTDVYTVCWSYGGVERCREISFDQLEYEEPDFEVPDGCTLGATHRLSTTSDQLVSYSSPYPGADEEFDINIGYEYWSSEGFVPGANRKSAVDTIRIKGSDMGKVIEHQFSKAKHAKKISNTTDSTDTDTWHWAGKSEGTGEGNCESLGESRNAGCTAYYCTVKSAEKVGDELWIHYEANGTGGCGYIQHPMHSKVWIDGSRLSYLGVNENSFAVRRRAGYIRYAYNGGGNQIQFQYGRLGYSTMSASTSKICGAGSLTGDYVEITNVKFTGSAGFRMMTIEYKAHSAGGNTTISSGDATSLQQGTSSYKKIKNKHIIGSSGLGPDFTNQYGWVKFNVTGFDEKKPVVWRYDDNWTDLTLNPPVNVGIGSIRVGDKAGNGAMKSVFQEKYPVDNEGVPWTGKVLDSDSYNLRSIREVTLPNETGSSLFSRIRIPGFTKSFDSTGAPVYSVTDEKVVIEDDMYLWSNTSTGTYQWTVPTDVDEIEVFMIGGGSSGMSGFKNGTPAGSGGGAGGQVNWLPVTTVPGESVNMFVGGGGDFPNGGKRHSVVQSNKGGATSFTNSWITISANGGPNVTDRYSDGPGGTVTATRTDGEPVNSKYLQTGISGGKGWHKSQLSRPGHGGTSYIEQSPGSPVGQEHIKHLIGPDSFVGLVPWGTGSGENRGYGGTGDINGVGQYNWQGQGSSSTLTGIYGSGGSGSRSRDPLNGGGDGLIVIRKSGSNYRYHEKIDRVVYADTVDDQLKLALTVEGVEFDIDQGNQWQVRETFTGDRVWKSRAGGDQIDISWSDWKVFIEQRAPGAESWVTVGDTIKKYGDGHISGIAADIDTSVVPSGGDCISIKTKHTFA